MNKKIFSKTLNKLDNVEFKVLNIISKNNIYNYQQFSPSPIGIQALDFAASSAIF